MQARQLFEKSLVTLTEDFPIQAMEAGIDMDLLTVWEIAKQKGIYNNQKEIRSATGMTIAQLEKLMDMGAIDKMSNNTYAIRPDFDWRKGGQN
jgi:hypothetical protein